MISRTLFFFLLYVYFSFSQELCYLDTTDSVFYNDNHYIELNNIGDPILFFIPLNEEKNFLLNHYSQKVRKIDFFNKINTNYIDSIYSHIMYNGAYKDGAKVEALLSRPVGKNMNLCFLYHNLSSLGYYINQHNKYNLLYFDLNYINQNNPYNFSFSFFSHNGDYKQNGGIQSNTSNVSLDLLEVYLDYAQTLVKNRGLKFRHRYAMKSNIILEHSIIFDLFDRKYTDQTTESFHYSLTSLGFNSLDNYQNETFLHRTLNSISISNLNLSVALNHAYYYADNFELNRFGNLDIIIESNPDFKRINKLDFKVGFCPFGYNQNNYVFHTSFYKTVNDTESILRFLIQSKKPNFFSPDYYDVYSFDWNSLLPINTIDANFLLKFNKRKINFSSSLKKYSNYLFFNERAYPEQYNRDIFYLNIKLDKIWVWDNISMKKTFCFQQSNNNILSVPSFIFIANIQHKVHLLGKFDLYNSLKINFFSKYYVKSYFPLTDVFYLQQEEKTGMVPLVSFRTSISQDRFSIGCVFDNIYHFFDNDIYLVQDYILPPTSLRLFIKWGFLN